MDFHNPSKCKKNAHKQGEKDYANGLRTYPGAMSYSETKSLPKRKAELEAEYHSMSADIREQVIPRAEASKERADLRIIAKEIVRDFRKAVVQRRRDLRKAEKDLSEICKW